MRGHATRDSATTLVEVAVGLAVGSLLVAGILILMGQTQKGYMHSSEVSDLQQNLRVAMDRMVRVIQAAGVNPRNQNWGGAGANNPAFTAFREAGRNCIRVYADLDGDGTVRQADENVYFHWSTTAGAPLRETRGPSGGIDTGTTWVDATSGPDDLARDIVANPVPPSPPPDMFQYFTGANDPLGAPNTRLTPPAANQATCASLPPADRERIARVVITITGRATIGSEPVPVTKTLTSVARARNVP
jgi:type II secretory pathway component PulJ